MGQEALDLTVKEEQRQRETWYRDGRMANLLPRLSSQVLLVFPISDAFTP